jgi:hypothetical protein
MSTRREVASELVEAIINDMTGRSGGDHWWDSIDAETQAEIRAKWAAIIKPHLSEES